MRSKSRKGQTLSIAKKGVCDLSVLHFDKNSPSAEEAWSLQSGSCGICNIMRKEWSLKCPAYYNVCYHIYLHIRRRYKNTSELFKSLTKNFVLILFTFMTNNYCISLTLKQMSQKLNWWLSFSFPSETFSTQTACLYYTYVFRRHKFSDWNGSDLKLAAWIMRFETEHEALSRRSDARLSTSLEHKAAHNASAGNVKSKSSQKSC